MHAPSRNLTPSGPQRWNKLESPHAKGYSPDEQIKHYEDWKDVFIGEMKTISLRNLTLAQDMIEKFIDTLKAKNIVVTNAYMRHDHPYNVDVLLTVDEDTFLSDGFRDAYILARELQTNSTDGIFKLGISFSSMTAETDEDIIGCDGYLLKRQTDEQPS